MRIVFMGTPRFAVDILDVCDAAGDLVAVYTRPDAASGRGARLRPTPVKLRAQELRVQVVEPPTLKDGAVVDELRGLRPDVIVVAAYGMLLPQEVLDVPTRDCVNVHASLLPRWRGAAPVQRAILAGDTVTGVSIMRMEAGLDTGPFCEVERVEIGEDDAEALTERLATAGATALARALPRIDDRSVTWTPQDPSLVTYAEKITTADVTVTPSLSPADAVRRVRASSPQAPSRMSVGESAVTVLSAQVAAEAVDQGSVLVSKSSVVVGVYGGSIELLRVKPDGRAAMSGADWARGARLPATGTWGGVQ